MKANMLKSDGSEGSKKGHQFEKDSDVSEGKTNLISKTIRHEIPFEAGTVEVVTEIRLKLNSGAMVSDDSLDSYLEAVSKSQKRLSTPEYFEPELFRKDMIELMKKIEQLIFQESAKKSLDNQKLDLIKQIKLQAENAKSLFEDGQIDEAQRNLYRALSNFDLVSVFPDEASYGQMTIEMFKACDFISPIVKNPKVNELARSIGSRIRDVWKNRKAGVSEVAVCAEIVDTDKEIA